MTHGTVFISQKNNRLMGMTRLENVFYKHVLTAKIIRKFPYTKLAI